MIVEFDKMFLMMNFGKGKWIEFDDDNPIPQREEDITKLSGGGMLQSSMIVKDTVVWIFNN